MIQIPLVDLKAQYAEIANEIHDGFDRVIKATSFILGSDVEQFEREYAAYCNIGHVIGVASGTDALEISLRVAGITQGDDVIVPTNSFIASALAVVRVGARPVLVDCKDDYLIDLGSADARLTPRTKAIMPVHLFGQCAPMKEVLEFAHTHRLVVIEDAAQAHGARQNGQSAGSFGLVSATSFYPGKNLGAFGDAGAVMTNNNSLAQRARAVRNYGSEIKYHHPVIGFNSRLDTLQAVVLRAKLKRLDKYNAARRSAAERYNSMLSDILGVTLPPVHKKNEHIWHIYAVQVPERERILNALHTAGIGAGVHYPVPIHLQGAFLFLGHRKGDFPVAEKAANRMISLPLYPEITPAQQEAVVSALRQALASHGA